MPEQKPLTQEQKDRKNRLARERRAAKKAQDDQEVQDTINHSMDEEDSGQALPSVPEALDFQQAEVKLLAQPDIAPELAKSQQGAVPPAIPVESSKGALVTTLLMAPTVEEPSEGLLNQQGSVPPVESSKEAFPDLPKMEGTVDAILSLPPHKHPPFKGPKFLISSDHKVYTNPQHPDSNGALTFIGFHLRVKGKDGQMEDKILELAREPANKKERRKAKAGLPFRDKKGVLA